MKYKNCARSLKKSDVMTSSLLFWNVFSRKFRIVAGMRITRRKETASPRVKNCKH